MRSTGFSDACPLLPKATVSHQYGPAQSHTPRNRCVHFVFGVAAASRNTRFQAAGWALPGPDLHRLDRTSLRLAHLFDHLVGQQLHLIGDG